MDVSPNSPYRKIMFLVSTLAQHIFSLDPTKDAARLALYNYLVYLCEPNEPLSTDLLNRFYRRALTFPHWQENKKQLFAEVEMLLQHFQQTHDMPFDFSQVLSAQQIQVLGLETQTNLLDLINRFVAQQVSAVDQFKVIPEGQDSALSIVLLADQSLVVNVFPRWASIVSGELAPLTTDFSLVYTPSLTLNPQLSHQLEVGGFTTARFRLEQQRCAGVMVRGYTFQKQTLMQSEPLQKFPMLFYPLKRLEQNFVNRKTEPMYVELTAALEKACDLLASGHPDARKFGQAAFERGRLALEHIFPDDRLVRLLIDNLGKTLALDHVKQNPQKSAHTDSSENSLAMEIDSPHDLTLGHDLLEELI